MFSFLFRSLYLAKLAIFPDCSKSKSKPGTYVVIAPGLFYPYCIIAMYRAYFLGIGGMSAGGSVCLPSSVVFGDDSPTGFLSGFDTSVASTSSTDVAFASLATEASAAFCFSSCRAFSAACWAARISSVREAHLRLPKIFSTSSVNITSRVNSTSASLLWPAACSRRICLARSYCSLMIRETSSSISLARWSL